MEVHSMLDLKDIAILEYLEEQENSEDIKEKGPHDFGLLGNEELRSRLNKLINEGYVKGSVTVTNTGFISIKHYTIREKGKSKLLNHKLFRKGFY